MNTLKYIEQEIKTMQGDKLISEDQMISLEEDRHAALMQRQLIARYNAFMDIYRRLTEELKVE